jgi:flagellar biosynthesis/type III secretory pathway M-ring protein FliF/YscJ
MQALRSYGDVIATVTVKLDVVSQRTTEKTITAVKSVESKNELNSTETSAPAAGGADPGPGAGAPRVRRGLSGRRGGA